MYFNHLLDINFKLFDGGAAGGTGTGGDGTASSGANNESFADAAQGKKTGGLSNVRYGKQGNGAVAAAPATDPQAKSPDAGGSDTQGEQTPPDTLETRQRKFDEIIRSDEYRDIYKQHVREMIERRLSKTKGIAEENTKLREIADILARKYGVTEDADFSKLKTAIESDDSIWEAAAEKAGMNVEQFKKFDAVQRENAAYKAAQQNDIIAAQNRRKMEGWFNEAQGLKQKFPNFDLRTELNDRNFFAAINAGVPMEMAYKGKYYDQFMGEATQNAAQSAEKRVVDNIRAKGQRPAENGASSQGAAFKSSSDVSKLTKAERAAIAKEILNGTRSRVV